MSKKWGRLVLGIVAILAGLYLILAPKDIVPEGMRDMCSNVVIDIQDVKMAQKIDSACQDPNIEFTIVNLGDQPITQDLFENSNYYFMFCQQHSCTASYSWYKVIVDTPIEPKQQGVIKLVKLENQPNGFNIFQGYRGEVSVTFDHSLEDSSTVQCTISEPKIYIEVAPQVGTREDMKKCTGN